MNPKNVELALKRQRLQLQAAAQRVMIMQAIESAAPAFGTAEKIRAFFRWAKRGFFVWRSLHRLRGAVESILPAR